MNYYFVVRVYVGDERYMRSNPLTTITSAVSYLKNLKSKGISILGFQFLFYQNNGKFIYFVKRFSPLGRYGLFDVVETFPYTPYVKYRSIVSFRKNLSKYTKYCFLHYN